MKNKLNKNFWNKHGHVVIIYVFLVALMLLVSVFSRDFFTIGNFKNLLRTSFPLLMVALGHLPSTASISKRTRLWSAGSSP